MAETLLAVILVTTSAKGANLVFRWPPNPSPSPRLCRPKPENDDFISQLDNPWRASFHNLNPRKLRSDDYDYGADPDYAWPRTYASRNDGTTVPSEYDNLFGLPCHILAGLLGPPATRCHQKFELVVDDLVFIGHPVCADQATGWSFKPEKPAQSLSRGREKRGKRSSGVFSPVREEREESVEPPTQEKEKEKGRSSWLQKFQVVFVLDRPDPSSSNSGNVLKYCDIIYEHVVFTLTAVLFQEQVLSNFVEAECGVLIPLREKYAEQGQPYQEFLNQALVSSSIAAAMKSLYEAIKTRSIAYITLNAIPLELQLPPHLDDLLHNEDPDPDSVPAPYDEKTESWGPELSTGWKLPELAPWKSLMLLDATDDSLEDPMASFRGPHVSAEDRALAEKLMRFMENVSVTLSLADMGNLLDWDLERQVYPVVRWLVQHRRAKVVDVVNPGLKTVFALPRQFPATPLAVLAKEFGAQFSHPEVPSLPKILSIVSSPSVTTKSHFFASVVKSKELIPMYHDVVSWMLKRDLIIILHLRIRVVATVEIKERVWAKRQEKLRRKGLALSTSRKTHRTSRSYGGDAAALVGSTWVPQSILNSRYALSHSHSHSHSSHRSSQKSMSSRRRSSADSKRAVNMSIQEEDEVSPRGLGFFNNSVFDDVNEGDSGSANSGYRFDVDRGSSSNSSSRGPSSVAYDSNREDGGDEEDEEDGGSDATLAEFAAGASSADPDSSMDRFRASMIEDPGRATALQAKWLSMMSDGKDAGIRKRFEKINPYFDGKHSDDEILWRADITRRELREVLHAYEPFLQTFLHPS
ncbi:nitrogen permease regulator of amino acid transport activity 3-domain-containing protein [Coprinopsis sp. MPI-PUGE-AT-0042]|nr:nitrogen permease regulator of amino acid transport activity 3-domain-containing protein [Coprinopsis sp. MPI-PUGE-AT-0042]